MIKSNISQLLRDQNVLTATKESVYKAAGTALKDSLLDEFEKLVYETPQYTGTTAASWKIGFYGKVDTSVEQMPKVTNVNDALHKGMDPACTIAIENAKESLTDDFSDYAHSDIGVFNEAPGYDTAEEGPVRPVNTPAGALKRFEGRIATMDIIADFQKVK